MKTGGERLGNEFMNGDFSTQLESRGLRVYHSSALDLTCLEFIELPKLGYLGKIRHIWDSRVQALAAVLAKSVRVFAKVVPLHGSLHTSCSLDSLKYGSYYRAY